MILYVWTTDSDSATKKLKIDKVKPSDQSFFFEAV